MSKVQRPRLSLKGDPNALTMAPAEQAPAETSAPIQEKQVEAAVEKIEEVAAEQSGPTAKQMAAAEEANALRIIQQKRAEEERAAKADEEPVSLIGLAAQGRDVLLNALRKHAEEAKPVEYVPPPRTARQMTQLEEELEAGRRAQARAEAQQASRPPPAPEPGKEGFSTPVYRPGDVVPNPTGGVGQFGADAP